MEQKSRRWRRRAAVVLDLIVSVPLAWWAEKTINQAARWSDGTTVAQHIAVFSMYWSLAIFALGLVIMWFTAGMKLARAEPKTAGITATVSLGIGAVISGGLVIADPIPMTTPLILAVFAGALFIVLGGLLVVDRIGQALYGSYRE